MNKSVFPQHELSVLHLPQALSRLASELERVSETVAKAKRFLLQLRTIPPSCFILLCPGQVLLVEEANVKLARLEGAPMAHPDEFEPNSYAVVRIPLATCEAPVETHGQVDDGPIDYAVASDALEAVGCLGQILFWPQLALENLAHSFLELVGASDDWLNVDTEVELTITGVGAVALQFTGSSVEVKARDSVRIDESGPFRSLNVPDALFPLSIYGFEVGFEADLRGAVK